MSDSTKNDTCVSVECLTVRVMIHVCKMSKGEKGGIVAVARLERAGRATRNIWQSRGCIPQSS